MLIFIFGPFANFADQSLAYFSENYKIADTTYHEQMIQYFQKVAPHLFLQTRDFFHQVVYLAKSKKNSILIGLALQK